MIYTVYVPTNVYIYIWVNVIML